MESFDGCPFCKMLTQVAMFCTTMNKVFLRYIHWSIENMANHLIQSLFPRNIIDLNAIKIANVQNCSICASNKMSALHKTNCILIFWCTVCETYVAGSYIRIQKINGKKFFQIVSPKHGTTSYQKKKTGKMKLHFRKKITEKIIFSSLSTCTMVIWVGWPKYGKCERSSFGKQQQDSIAPNSVFWYALPAALGSETLLYSRSAWKISKDFHKLCIIRTVILRPTAKKQSCQRDIFFCPIPWDSHYNINMKY